MDQPPRPDTARYAALCASLAAEPWRHDFLHTLRLIEALHPQLPRLGRASQPRDEPIRLGQEVELDFAPAPLQSFAPAPQQPHQPLCDQPPRLGQRVFGLFGSMGPLPLHLTEYVRERSRHHGDATPAAFADVFHHRLTLLFYRAWAQAQPTCQLDRPADDAFSRWIGALPGLGQPALRQRGVLTDAARLQHAGWLAGGTRHAEGLTKILRQYFGVPVRLEQNAGHWLWLDADERPRLRPASSNRQLVLGRTAAIGHKVWDRQHRVRLHFGPLGYDQYCSFLPGRAAEAALRDWLRLYLGLGFSCEARLMLRGSEVPPLRLGRRPVAAATGRPPEPPVQPDAGRLGRTAWLGRAGQTRRPLPHRDRADLRLVLDLQPTTSTAHPLRQESQP